MNNKKTQQNKNLINSFTHTVLLSFECCTHTTVLSLSLNKDVPSFVHHVLIYYRERVHGMGWGGAGEKERRGTLVLLGRDTQWTGCTRVL